MEHITITTKEYADLKKEISLLQEENTKILKDMRGLQNVIQHMCIEKYGIGQINIW